MSLHSLMKHGDVVMLHGAVAVVPEPGRARWWLITPDEVVQLVPHATEIRAIEDDGRVRITGRIRRLGISSGWPVVDVLSADRITS